MARSEAGTLAQNLIEKTIKGVGAGFERGLVGLDLAGECFVPLLKGEQLVGDVEGGEHGYAQRIDSGAVGGDGAHFRVDEVGELLDVNRILATQVVGLVVDFNGDVLVVAWCGHSLFRLAEFVELLHHALDAAAYLLAFLFERFEASLGHRQMSGLLIEQLLQGGSVAFRGCASFALGLEELDCAEHALLEYGKIIRREGIFRRFRRGKGEGGHRAS